MNPKEEFDIVLSYASEQGDYVEKVAQVLSLNNIKVFYDKDNSVDLWGKDLYQHLDEIYKNKSKFCVIFISKDYRNKAWTNHELKSAQERSLQENKEYILPVIFDNTELPGLRNTIAYIDANKISPHDLAKSIMIKLGKYSKCDGRLVLPKIPPKNFNPYTENMQFFKELRKAMTEGSRCLEDFDIKVIKIEDNDDELFYHYNYKGNLVYFLRIKIGGLLGSSDSLFFYDGCSQPIIDDNVFTALSKVEWDRELNKPVINFINFNCLTIDLEGKFSFDQFNEMIWKSICKKIERLAR